MDDPNNQQPTGQGDQTDQNSTPLSDKSILLPRIDQTMVLPNAIKPRHLLSAGTNSRGSVPMSDGTTFQVSNLASIFPFISGAKYVRISGGNLPIGDNDLYTVPPNKKCLVLGMNTNIISSFSKRYNPSAGTIGWYTQLKVDNNYYRLRATTPMTTGTLSALAAIPSSIVLNSGETFSVNTATTAGLNFWTMGIEYDKTIATIRGIRSLQLISGDNIIYTVPPNKSASFITAYSAGQSSAGISNSSGGTLTYTAYIIPVGETAGVNNQSQVGLAVTNLSHSTFEFGTSLNPGDSIVINSTGGGVGQVFWTTVFEI